MRPNSLPIRRNLAAVVLSLITVASASAQENSAAPYSYSNNTETAGPPQNQANTPQAATAPTEGVGYSTLFHQTGGPMPSLLNISETPNLNPQVGGASETTTIKVRTSGLGPYANLFAFRHGLPPENAQLKLGIFYFHLDDLTAGLLYYDSTQPQINGNDKWISIMEAGMTLTAQVGEDTNIALHGTLIYLPFQNKIGVDSIFSYPYFLSLGAELTPTMEAQITHNVIIRDWPITFADDFRISYGRYDDSVINDFDSYLRNVPLTQFVGQDVVGPYHFGPRARRAHRVGNQTEFDSTTFDQEFTDYSNTVSALTQKDLPNDLLFTARAYHENIWYQTSEEGLPSWRESAMARLESVKESMRFKPFIQLVINRVHLPGTTSTDEELRVGASGPITENMFALAEAGAVFAQNSYNTTTAVGRLSITHQINDTTSQGLTAERRVSDFRDEIENDVQYNIRHQFGPYIQANGVVGVGQNQQNSPYTVSSDETIAGISFSLDPSPKTRVELLNFFQHLHRPDLYQDVFTTQLGIQYQFTDDFVGHAVYRYRNEHASDAAFTYQENLFYVSLTKFFQ